MSDTEHRQKNQDISWKVVAYALGTICWTICVAMLIWLCNGVSVLKQDVAVIKNVLHINEAVGYHENQRRHASSKVEFLERMEK